MWFKRKHSYILYLSHLKNFKLRSSQLHDEVSCVPSGVSLQSAIPNFLCRSVCGSGGGVQWWWRWLQLPGWGKWLWAHPGRWHQTNSPPPPPHEIKHSLQKLTSKCSSKWLWEKFSVFYLIITYFAYNDLVVPDNPGSNVLCLPTWLKRYISWVLLECKVQCYVQEVQDKFL